MSPPDDDPQAFDPTALEPTPSPPPPSSPRAALASGTILGPYRILAVLGRGGMGTVYRAHDTSLDREVALKTITHGLGADPDYVRRFRAEAQAAARICHPNLVQVYFCGEASETLFFAMELVSGQSLGERLRAAGRLPWSEAVRYAVDAARALEAAASQGILHRDVKPENLLVAEDGTVKVTDFGLAKRIGDAGATAAGVIVGTPRYMSPEQAQGEPLDLRSDMYSLGATLFHLVTGRPVFDGDSAMKVCMRQIQEAPPDLTRAAPDLPPALSRVVARTLAKRRDDRHPSYAELIAELEAIHASAHDATVLLPAPGAPPAHRPLTAGMPPAPRGRRLLADVADFFHLLVVFIVFEFVLWPLPASLHTVLHVLVGSLAAAAHVLYLSRHGGTVGERLLELRLVGPGGRPPSDTSVLAGWLLTKWNVLALFLFAPPFAATWGITGNSDRLLMACVSLGFVSLLELGSLLLGPRSLRDRIFDVTVVDVRGLPLAEDSGA